MGLFDSGILGGALGGSAFKAPGTEIRQQPLQTKEQKALFKQLINLVSPEIGQPGPVFPGERIAPLSGLQEQGLGLAGDIPGAIGQAQDIGIGGIQNILQGQNFFDPAIQAAQNLFENTIAPNILGTFAQTGSASSGLAQKALGEAGSNLSLQLAQLLSGQQLQQQGQQISALSQLPGFAGLTGQGAGQLTALGGLPRQIEQLGLDVEQQRFREQQPLFSPFFSVAQQLTGTPTVENIAFGTPAGLGRELLGAAASGAGAGFAGGFSDERLKENIETIGFIGKVRLVTWEWKENAYGLVGRSIGVIAQELEKIFPDLVIEMRDGYKGVNYSGLQERLV